MNTNTDMHEFKSFFSLIKTRKETTPPLRYTPAGVSVNRCGGSERAVKPGKWAEPRVFMGFNGKELDPRGPLCS